MIKFYCYGKKGYCKKRIRCFEEDCPYYDGSGGKEVETNVVKRFWKALRALVRRK